MVSTFFSVSQSLSEGAETVVSLSWLELLPACATPLLGRSASASGSCCGAVATRNERLKKIITNYKCKNIDIVCLVSIL